MYVTYIFSFTPFFIDVPIPQTEEFGEIVSSSESEVDDSTESSDSQGTYISYLGGCRN